MRTETELRAKLAEAGEKMNSRDVKGGCRDDWGRFAIKLRSVLGPPMQTEEEVCARLDKYMVKMNRPGLQGSAIMRLASRAAHLQWILQPPEPVIDEAKVANAQEKSNATGKPVFVWADTEGTHTATKRPGRKCKMLVPEEEPPKPKPRLRVHVPRGVKAYTRSPDTRPPWQTPASQGGRTYAQRQAKAAERAAT